MTDPMITAANTLEASPKPSYGPHKANERYLDGDDRRKTWETGLVVMSAAAAPELIGEDFEPVTVSELLQALETLRTHLRRKYYGG